VFRRGRHRAPLGRQPRPLSRPTSSRRIRSEYSSVVCAAATRAAAAAQVGGSARRGCQADRAVRGACAGAAAAARGHVASSRRRRSRVRRSLAAKLSGRSARTPSRARLPLSTLSRCCGLRQLVLACMPRTLGLLAVGTRCMRPHAREGNHLRAPSAPKPVERPHRAHLTLLTCNCVADDMAAVGMAISASGAGVRCPTRPPQGAEAGQASHAHTVARCCRCGAVPAPSAKLPPPQSPTGPPAPAGAAWLAGCRRPRRCHGSSAGPTSIQQISEPALRRLRGAVPPPVTQHNVVKEADCCTRFRPAGQIRHRLSLLPSSQQKSPWTVLNLQHQPISSLHAITSEFYGGGDQEAEFGRVDLDDKVQIT